MKHTPKKQTHNRNRGGWPKKSSWSRPKQSHNTKNIRPELIEGTATALRYLVEKSGIHLQNLEKSALQMILAGNDPEYMRAPTPTQVDGILEACKVWQPYCHYQQVLIMHSFKRMLAIKTSVIHAQKGTGGYIGKLFPMFSKPPYYLTTIVHSNGQVTVFG